MSRIGNKVIQIPKNVQLQLSAGNEVSVKGPKGTLLQKIDPDIKIDIKGDVLKVSRPTEQKRHKAMHGLYRNLINNMIQGVTQGYTKNLELVGIGYKASAQGNVLDLTLGYSHNILFVLPPEIKVKSETPKGSNPLIMLEGIDKQLLGQVAAKIRSLRKPEPYQGKGIKYVDEFIKRKAGKAAAKK